MRNEFENRNTSETICNEFHVLQSEIERWKKETMMYRWLNIFLFMTCKLIVPTGALIIAVNMVSDLFGTSFIDRIYSTIIAIIVTLMASIEALLNPASKKRLAFNLNNELRELLFQVKICQVESGENEQQIERLKQFNEKFKKLLNHYSENGY